MKHLVTMAEQKGCHGGETKMLPPQNIQKWCHGNISVPLAHGDTGKRKRTDERNMIEMVGCSRLPGSHGIVAWKRVTIRTRCKHTVHLIHARASHRGRLGLYLWSVRFRAERVRYDVRVSRHSQVDVEVVVHVATVVVHHWRCTRSVDELGVIVR